MPMTGGGGSGGNGGGSMWGALAAAVAPMIISLFTNKKKKTDTGQDYSRLLQSIPELQQMIRLQQTQAQRADPLIAAVQQMSMNLLPRSSQGPAPGRQSFYTPPAPPAAPTGRQAVLRDTADYKPNSKASY